jgi:hypothetical protein
VCALGGFGVLFFVGLGLLRLEVVADCGFKLVTIISGVPWHSMLGLSECLVEGILFALILGHGSASLARR